MMVRWGMRHHLSSVCALANGQLADLRDHLPAPQGAISPLYEDVVGEEEAFRQAPAASFGHGRDEFLDVADPSVVVFRAVGSPGNGYGDRQCLLAECISDSRGLGRWPPLPLAPPHRAR